MDKIFDLWFESEMARVQSLAADSGQLDVLPLGGHRFLAHFACRGLVLGKGGQPEEHDRFLIGVHIADDYLRRVPDPLKVLSCLAPDNAYHPNLRSPVICVGPIVPGTSLVELIHRAHAILTYQELMPTERDALNLDACSWARNHPERFPIDDRPLKKRRPPSSQQGEQAVMS